jgi:flagellar motor switch/type III secretory pathway protein FliN
MPDGMLLALVGRHLTIEFISPGLHMHAPAFTVSALSAFGRRLKPADHRAVRFRSKTLELNVRFDGAPPAFSGERYCVSFEIDGERGYLLAATQLLLLPVAALFDGRHSRALGAEHAELILEASLSEKIEAIEHALDANIQIEAVTRMKPAEGLAREQVNGLAYVTLEFETGNGGQALADCFLPPAVAARLVTVWHDFDPDMDVTAELRLGTTSLTVSQIADLQAGDVVMLERTPLHDRRLLLVVEDCAAVMLDLADDDEATMRGAFESMETPALEPFVARPRGPDWYERDLVPLTVTLARMQLPFSRLAAINLDAPFELPGGLDGPVSLWAGDIELAVGRLVLAGDGFGLRITEANKDV